MDNGILEAGRAEHAMWLAWRLPRRLFCPCACAASSKIEHLGLLNCKSWQAVCAFNVSADLKSLLEK